jgi:hypothetical protein
MRTKRNRNLRRQRTRRLAGGKRKSEKKWITAIDAAQKTLKKTGDIEAAKRSLRRQALTNARKLFGSISSSM